MVTAFITVSHKVDGMARPLLKWAGGKRQLLHEIITRLPSGFSNYWEPFFGGGALFFSISEEFCAHSYTISDINSVLCLFYETVRDKPMDLAEYLAGIEYHNTPSEYYEARSRFNLLDGKANPVEKSGLLIYLNRHCFNGLYRVNSHGEFNVPFGSYISPRMPGRNQIMEASKCLSRSTILNRDFQDILTEAEEGDFVYLDPPYEPVSQSSSFTAYSKEGFNRDQQKRLSSMLWELDNKGVKFLLSNSGNEYLEELYSAFKIVTVGARRNINSKGNSRGNVKEILVTNY